MPHVLHPSEQHLVDAALSIFACNSDQSSQEMVLSEQLWNIEEQTLVSYETSEMNRRCYFSIE